jgi:hypothetical protein
MRDEVIKRLESLNYTFDAADEWALMFLIEKVTNRIKNECNVTGIPAGLREIAVDIICGEFLLMKKNSGKLGGFEADIDSAVLKQVQEGDTNVVFAADKTASAEQRLDALIYHLMNCGKPQFATYRRLAW